MHGGARASPDAAARKGRLTTIMPEAAVVAGLPSGAVGAMAAGTPPDRGAGARVTPRRPSGSAGPRTTRRGGTLVAVRMAPADCARAGAWQPACAELAAITIGLRLTMPGAAGTGSGGRSAGRASIESAACGRASGRRLQLERLAAPAAACSRLHVSRSRSRSGVGHRSRATVFRVCEELEGKLKIGDPETRQLCNISVVPVESSPLLVSIS
eukprot:scaffold16167_cov115-Isochrysis_galbana.AAC.1